MIYRRWYVFEAKVSSRHTEYVICTQHSSVLEISLHFTLHSRLVWLTQHILIRLYILYSIPLWLYYGKLKWFRFPNATRLKGLPIRNNGGIYWKILLQIKFHNAFIHFMFNLILLREWKIFYLNYLLKQNNKTALNIDGGESVSSV